MTSDHLETITFSGGVRAHTPLSPVHLRAVRNADNIELSWTRRGRISADNWTGAEIPEDEDQSQFLIKIFNGTQTIHEAISDTLSYVYEGDQQLADFGEYPSDVVFSVQQIGGQIAQGISRTATISL